MSQFLMDHAALLESIIWRARQAVEGAYLRSHSFLSLMHDMADCVAQCLADLFIGPHLSGSLWLSLSSGCDKVNTSSVNSDNRIVDSAKLTELLKSASYNSLGQKCTTKSNNNRSCSSLNSSCEMGLSVSDCSGSEKNGDYNLLSFTRFLKSDCNLSEKKCYNYGKNFVAEKFIRELCELLESVDVKHTNL